MNVQAVYVGSRGFERRPVPEEEVGAGEVLVQVAYTGVCGTDLHVYHGDMDARVQPPAVIGHEMSGRIGAVGSQVSGLAVGDPVTVLPLSWCGECPACRAGHSYICHRLRFLGLDAPGAMQQQWRVSAEIVIPLPTDLPLRDAALVEPTAVAVHDVRRAEVAPGEQVVVVGAGPVGLLIALVARDAGGEVVVVEPNEHRRAVGERLGLWCLDPFGTDVAKEVEQWTDSAGAAVAFEVSGAPGGVTTAVDVLGTRGRLGLVAIHSQPREVNLHRFFWRELTLLGSRLYERRDYERAVELVAGGAIPADELITSVLPLNDVAHAFELIESGAGVMKVLIDCQEAGS